MMLEEVAAPTRAVAAGAAAQGAGGGGGRTAGVALNRLITQEESPEGVLCLVAEELGNLSDVNVSTAFSKLGKLCRSRSFPRNVAADERFRGLTVLALAMCADGRLQARNVANITHAVGKMSAAGKLAADDADFQDTLAALEGRVMRMAPDPDMKPQEVANAILAFATLGLMPGAEIRAALEAAVVRVAPDMKPQETANVAWSYATLGLMPGAEARAALEAAVVRMGLDMNPQETANVAWSYATLGLMPGAEARAALEAAVVRVGPAMTAQAVSTKIWSVLSLAATRAVPLPACYPSLWQAAFGFEERSFNRVEISMLFHAHLIHTELVGGVPRGEVTFPPWIMHQAREAWMYSARDDVTVSRSVKEIASILGDLGIRNEVERLTDDSYFSVDVYLPDDDVALEFDGPSHFIQICDGGEGAAPGGVGDASRASTRKTMRTELRDMFLARRHLVVLPVPYFEFAELKGRTVKTEYVAEKLRAAGVAMQAVNRDGEEEKQATVAS
jgi:hypothetical protein